MNRRGTGSLFRKTYRRAGRKYTEPTWTIQFYANGRRVREATGLRDKQAAQRILNKKLTQVDLNQYRRTEPIRCEALFAALREQYLNNRKEATAKRLACQWKEHLGPAFANVFATSITTDHVIHYTSQRREEGAAAATINRELAALRHMFRIGKKSTPPKVLEVPYIPFLTENNTRTGFVEDADFSRLAAEARDLWLRAFLELAYEYGWRRGELLGLRVRQVNLATRTIRLDPGSTKNKAGREVAMSTRVHTLLQQCVRDKLPDDYVLTRKGNRVVDMTTAWQNLCVRAGLGEFVCRACEHTVMKRKKCECGNRARKYRGLIPHDLRRSAAKALRRAGVPESIVQEMGGWKTAAMFRRYAIVSSSDQRTAVEMRERARTQGQIESPAYSPSVVPDPAKVQ